MEDLILRDYVVSAASQINAGGGSNGFNPTNLGMTDFSLVATTLDTNNAYKFMSGIEGMDRFGTGPVRDAYLALGHVALAKDLNNVNGFISKWNYPNQNEVVRSEWGCVNNVRFMLSSVGSVSPNASALGNNVYNTFIQGMEALACVEQDNYSARFLYRPPVFSDPLFQNVTIGYVFAEVPRILNDLWITNMRSTLR